VQDCDRILGPYSQSGGIVLNRALILTKKFEGRWKAIVHTKSRTKSSTKSSIQVSANIWEYETRSEAQDQMASNKSGSKQTIKLPKAENFIIMLDS